ncbi:MAG: hypothetical protein ACK5JF_03775 [Oscillospiraceae bacterium]
MKPILFNAEMVKAILAGRKTVTRRVVKPQPDRFFEMHESPLYLYSVEFDKGRINAPCQKGDILYVRETWCKRLGDVSAGEYIYKAHLEPQDEIHQYALDQNKWLPSIHMPKVAARIFLRVTDVRAERLQDITEEQAKREGVIGLDPWKYADSSFYEQNGLDTDILLAAFAGLWNSTLPKNPNKFKCPENSWEANPWVWVIEFERIEKSEET